MMNSTKGSSVVSQPLKSPHQQSLDPSLQQQQQHQQQSPASLPGLDTRKHHANMDTDVLATSLKNQKPPRRIPRDLESSVDPMKLIGKVQTEDRGRIMVAKSPIPSGTLLIDISPQAAICDSESRRKRCGFCLGPLNKSWKEDEEEDLVLQKQESKPWLNHTLSADQESTKLKVVKDECTGCGEIWYCDAEHQDEDGEEEEEEEKEDGAKKEGDVAVIQNKDKGRNKATTTTTHRKSCRDQDWEALHRFECWFLKRLFDHSTPPASTMTLGPEHDKAIASFQQLDPYDQDYCRLLIRILIHRFNELEETDGQDQQPNDDESNRGPDSFERVMYLVENREQFPDDRLFGPMTDVARILDAFQEHLEVYDQSKQTLATEPSANGSSLRNDHSRNGRRRRYTNRLSLDELLSLVCKEECNSFGLYHYPNWKPTRPYYDDHHRHVSEEGSGGSSLQVQKDYSASYFEIVRSMNAQDRERYHNEHPDRVPHFLRPGFDPELLASSPLSSNPSKDQEALLLLSPIERDRQRQERILNSPNPKLGYGLAYFLRFDTPLCNHSCSPNLYHVASNQDRLLIYTARDIAPGEELNLAYLEFGPGYRLFKDDMLRLEGGTESEEAETARVLALERRRNFLKYHFHFDCGCSRCQMELAWKDRLDALKVARKQRVEGLLAKNEKLEIHENKQNKQEKEVNDTTEEIKKPKNSVAIQLNGDASTKDVESTNLGSKEEEEEQDDMDLEVFLREGLMCQRQIINVQNGRLVGSQTDNSCYGFYAPPSVLARMEVDQFKDYKYKYEGQRREPWACVACGHEQQKL